MTVSSRAYVCVIEDCCRGSSSPCGTGWGCPRPSSAWNQADRAISTGPLNALPRLYFRPIDVMVCHGSQGYLVLRGASRLDAFSGYPVRT